jgi:MoxR-like ATPase
MGRGAGARETASPALSPRYPDVVDNRPGSPCAAAPHGAGELSVEAVAAALAEHEYIADEGLATAIFLAIALERPLLLEGEAGVGKTEVAKVLSRWTGGRLIRLQCYEGIDVSQAVYEWDYARQLLHLRAAEIAGAAATEEGGEELTDAVYSERFLVRRALLAAIDHGGGPPPVLLIDEVDRADDEFEAFLLEILSEYAVTVPELGTFRAAVPPRVIITSNRTRDVHDALKRRCLYHWVAHPDFEREVAIVSRRAPGAVPLLVRQVAAAVESLRTMHLYKPPGVAETIDWAAALAALGRTGIDEHTLDVTLGTVLKYEEDQSRVRGAGLGELVRAAVLRGA